MSDIVDHRTETRDSDRRVQKTRAALRTAFVELILTRGFDAVSAADVAEHANVGRSTFYEHFQGKDDILALTLTPILSPLADACIADAAGPRLIAVIEHFWQNRQLGRVLMAGRARQLMSRQLAGLIEDRLSSLSQAEGSLPAALSALQLAHGELALIDGWLSGRHGVSAEAVAYALHAGSSAMALALRGQGKY